MLFYTKKRESRVSYGLSFFPAIERSSLALFFLGFFQVFFVLGKFFFKAVDTALVDFLQEGFGAHVHHVVVHDELHLLGVHVQETIYTGAAPFLVVRSVIAARGDISVRSHELHPTAAGVFILFPTVVVA